MGLLTSLSFWIMCGMMWLLVTPSLVSVISAQNFTGIEAFLMGVLPWAVLLAIVGRILSMLRSGGNPA